MGSSSEGQENEDNKLYDDSKEEEIDQLENEEKEPLTIDTPEKHIDSVLSELKFGKFNIKVMILCGSAYFSACAEMLLIVFLSKPIKEEWQLDNMIFPLLPFCQGILGIVGSFIFGTLSDKYGRQRPLLAAISLVALFGVVSAFVPNFWLLVIVRGMVSFSTSGIEAVNFVLMLEFLPVRKRGSIMVVITCCGALGAIYTAGMAWLLLPRYGWQWFVGACSVPACLTVLYRVFVMNYESPRYLFVSEQKDKGLEVLKEMARQNNTHLHEGNIVCPPSANRGRIKDLFSEKLQARTFFATFVWFFQSMGFWGVTMYLPEYMGSLGMDPYFNSFFIFVGEIPGMFLAMILIEPHMLGRIKCLRFFSFFTATCLLLFAFIPLDFLKAVFVITVYFFMAPIYSILNTFTPEVYPTDTRSIAMAWVYMIISFPGLIMAFIGASVLTTNIKWLYPTVAAGFFVLQFLFTFGLKVEPSKRGLQDNKLEVELPEGTNPVTDEEKQQLSEGASPTTEL